MLAGKFIMPPSKKFGMPKNVGNQSPLDINAVPYQVSPSY